jgi:hypothetical protein
MTRLTARTVAEREVGKLQARIERHQLEIQNLSIEQDRWQRVLDALDADGDHADPQPGAF